MSTNEDPSTVKGEVPTTAACSAASLPDRRGYEPPRFLVVPLIAAVNGAPGSIRDGVTSGRRP